ncbi:hypothetical protein F441_12816 [Phytophthora nicotianae CJ01A1]|uniref:Uncharacterized protein n=6 Tax=Phytophthora nicotianae TaxID=4792 RepID=W2PXN2_PHYN3|nr:hypothetical protein PPTG_23488 [Phytophthora nicotianae INRA-310]ETI41975.1 hypothetical protein F443_12858 [Phytophthora nicotianae P1569]ETK81971.1 hypothetical protein L915_12570 [Phytophthora nicotianae]ETO70595.1 hypothetical protein F444_12964 [Phytophthora nicotianae P1976]ETP11719.1 hypothetical protein F441_12816 [Phytophthora nicotianae CJ01A1]ETP39801.1 hypothetical protein F442_12764 [Phytophthora nicotianae P10297]
MTDSGTKANRPAKVARTISRGPPPSITMSPR